MSNQPKVNSAAERELDKAAKQIDAFEADIKKVVEDRQSLAPAQETEQQTRLSSNQIADSKDIYLKPKRNLSCRVKFNEAYRDDYNFAKEYVLFIAENKEILGEKIELWTKPFAGVPYEEWEVPCNKPVWGPRYLAEQIKKCRYHRLTMDNKIIETGGYGSIYGQMAVDSVVQRLDATPTTKKKSIFMGASGF